MATREKYDLTKIGDAILISLDTMAKTPPPTKVRTGSKRAVLTQDRVRDRIRAMLDQGYAPSDIAEACKAAGMPILGKTITQYCRTPDGEPARAPTRRKRRSRRKSAAAIAATGTTSSVVSDPDTVRASAAQLPVHDAVLAPATSTDPNDELRRLFADGEEDSSGGPGRKKRRGNFIGED